MESISAGLNALSGWLLIASLKSIPLIIALLVAQHGLKRYLSASARHSLWLSVFICLSIPFGWEFSINKTANDLLLISPDTLIVQKSIQQTISPIKTQAASSSSTIPNNNTDLDKLSESFSIYSLLGYIWATVFCCLSAITLWQIRHFSRIQKAATPANQQQGQLLLDCSTKFAIHQKIPLLYSSQIQSPLTCGLLKPVIILPKNIEQQLSQTQLSHVLLHELGHIKRYDILWNWIAHWVMLLHWFNPLVWFAGRRMKADMEMACDATVLAHIAPHARSDYGMTLINVSQLISEAPRLSHSLGILENHHELKYRLIMIKEFTAMTLKKSLAFGFAFSLFTIAALAKPETTIELTPDTKPKEIAGKIAPEASITLQEFAAKAEQDLKTKILIGIDSNSKIQANLSKNPISYEQLLTQLQINGFTAFKTKDYIQILSVRDARTMAPIAEKGKTYYDDEFVTDYIKLEKSCAASVLATVRPLVPQYGFLSTYEDANTLIIVDTFSNILRVRNVVATIEKNLNAAKDCDSPTTQKIIPSPKK